MKAGNKGTGEREEDASNFGDEVAGEVVAIYAGVYGLGASHWETDG